MASSNNALADSGGEKHCAPYDKRKIQSVSSEQIADPHDFELDGIKVKVRHDGTADLGELVKSLFLT